MATGIIYTVPRGKKAVIRTSATVTANLADFASPNNAVDNVAGLSLSRIWWSTDQAGGVAYQRGASVLLKFNGSGVMDFNGVGVKPDTDNLTANLTLTLIGANTSVVAEFSKQSAIVTEY